MQKTDALSLEYKLMNGTAFGNLDLADAVNNPVGLGIAWISGYGLTEQLRDFIGSQLRSVSDHYPGSGTTATAMTGLR